MKRNMTKKIGSVALLFALLFSLAGCQFGSIALDGETGVFDLSQVEPYSGTPYVEVNDNVPYFTEEELTEEPFEHYSRLDKLGRCGVAYANICHEIMPTEKRGDIGMVKPSGWQTTHYDEALVEGHSLYNRCHLIGYQLSGENANEKNLITGTRYMNAVGMLPFEDAVDDYVDATDHHVLYRVTPVFEGSNLVASGVLMEAFSVEDHGRGVCFNVFVYNVQPGVTINYATGNNWRSTKPSDAEVTQYIGNRNSQIFHRVDCGGLPQEQNRVYFDTRDKALNAGYKPCSYCNP